MSPVLFDTTPWHNQVHTAKVTIIIDETVGCHTARSSLRENDVGRDEHISLKTTMFDSTSHSS